MMSNIIVKITSINNQNNSKSPTFTSIYNNKALQKTFKFAEENGTLFVASTSLVLSAIVRPLVILATPKTDKENKNYAISKSIASSITGFGIMLIASLPLARAIKKIDAKPLKYLKKETINNLSEKNIDLKNSKPYIFSTQIFKLGLGLILAAPKAMLTCAMITPLTQKIFNKEKENKKITSFKGVSHQNILSKIIGKIIDKKAVQNFAHRFKNSNYEMAIISATDIFATFGFMHQNKKNNKISEEHKKALNHNVLFGTSMSILSAYTLDKALDKKTNKFIENFEKANKNLKDLPKYIEGIRITKKVFILGGLYYCVIPFLATFLSDKTSK